jgi:hypothetical protein
VLVLSYIITSNLHLKDGCIVQSIPLFKLSLFEVFVSFPSLYLLPISVLSCPVLSISVLISIVTIPLF